MRNSRWRGMRLHDDKFAKLKKFLLEYLGSEERTEEKLEVIIKLAKFCLFNPQDHDEEVDAEGVVKKIIEGDKEEWVLLLHALMISGAHGSGHFYYEFKKLSPFPDKMLVFIKHGMVATIGGLDLEEYLDRVIIDQKGWRPSFDEFALILPFKDMENKEIDTYWIGSAYLGKKGPESL